MSSRVHRLQRAGRLRDAARGHPRDQSQARDHLARRAGAARVPDEAAGGGPAVRGVRGGGRRDGGDHQRPHGDDDAAGRGDGAAAEEGGGRRLRGVVGPAGG